MLGQVVTITLAADAGGAIGIAMDGQSKPRLHRLVWMAAGAMLAVTCLDMLPEAARRIGVAPFGVSVLLGAALIAWMARRAPSVCPACDLTHAGNGEGVAVSSVWLITLALSIHSMLDGIGLAASTRLPAGHDLGVFFGMGLHKLPEGLAMALLLLGTGLRREAAFGWTLFAEAFTLVGALAVVWVGALAQAPALAAVVAFVGGGFLVLVLRVFIEAFRSVKDRMAAALWSLSGFAGTALVALASRGLN